MIRFFQQLFKREFFRNVATLVTGTSLAQGLLVIATPILTRLYTPSDFGVLGVFMTISGIISVMSCGRYEFAILVPQQEEDAACLLILSLVLALTTTALVLTGIFFFEELIIGLIQESESTSWLWFFPLSILSAAVFQAFNYWCVRKKEFQRIAISRLSQSIITLISQIFVAVFWFANSFWLIAGYVFGQIAAAAVLGVYILHEDKKSVVIGINSSLMKRLAKEYKKFPIFNSWPSLLDSLRSALPVMFLFKYYGSSVTGYYSLAMRILWLPSSLLSASISQVLFQRIAEAYANAKNIGPYIEKTFQWLMLIALPYLGLMLMSPLFFEFIFGSGWKTTGLYALILAPATAVMFVVSPLSITPSACYRQEISAIWQVSAILATLFFLVSSLFLDSPAGLLIILSVTNMILYIVYAVLIFRVAGASFRRVMIPKIEKYSKNYR